MMIKYTKETLNKSLVIAGTSLFLGLAPQLSFAANEQILFDDFNYNSTAELTKNGWNVRTYPGGPGLSNGGWDASNVSFVDTGINKSMRLRATTNINGSNIVNGAATQGSSSQSEVRRSESKYKNGTWATRMYFNDAPLDGPDGDSVVETFFGITKYIEGSEPYSEIDFEYLANGGWYTGTSDPAMWSGTYRIVDHADTNSHANTKTVGSLQGWHDLVMQVQDNKIDFFIDGNHQRGFTGSVAPDHPMYLMFQIWFSNDCYDTSDPCTKKGYLNNSTERTYYEDVDWVYFEKDTLLTPVQVSQTVQSLRDNNINYIEGIKPAGVDSGDPGEPVDDSDSATPGKYCDWHETTYAICNHVDDAWGWQDNASCVGRNLCAALPAPYGIIDNNDPDPGDGENSAFSLTIQAEAYTNMSGVQLENTTDSGGGQNVGGIDSADWMSYANINIPSDGSYLVEYRVSSVSGGKLALDLSPGNSIGSVVVPATGCGQNWVTVSHVVTIPAGEHSLGLYASQGGWNINWFKITQQ